MLRRHIFGIVAVEGGTPILRGHSIHIGVMLDHSGIAGATGLHIEVAEHNGGQVRNLLAVFFDQIHTVHLTLIAEAEVGVHHGEGLAAFLFFQNHIFADAVAVVMLIPAAGFHFRCVGEPEVTGLQTLKFISAPIDGRALCLGAAAAVLQEHIVFAAVILFEIRLPLGAGFLKTDDVGLISGNNLRKAGRTLRNGISVGIVAVTNVETDDVEIHNAAAFMLNCDGILVQIAGSIRIGATQIRQCAGKDLRCCGKAEGCQCPVAVRQTDDMVFTRGKGGRIGKNGDFRTVSLHPFVHIRCAGSGFVITMEEDYLYTRFNEREGAVQEVSSRVGGCIDKTGFLQLAAQFLGNTQQRAASQHEAILGIGVVIPAGNGLLGDFQSALVMFAISMLTFSVAYVNWIPSQMARLMVGITAATFGSYAIGAFLAAPYLVPAQLAAAEAEVTGVSNPSMYFAVQGLVTAVVGAFSTGLVWPNLRNVTPGGNDLFGAHLMPYIAALGCVLAFFIAMKLPKMFDSFGKDQ